jgi:hypothetical protein
MATPFIFTIFIEYEDNNGNLTGDQDVFTFYSTDVTLAKATLGAASGGNTFVFTRANGRITDFQSATAATVVRAQLVLNNLPRNVYWSFAAQAYTALRKQTNIRIAAGSQVELLCI